MEITLRRLGALAVDVSLLLILPLTIAACLELLGIVRWESTNRQMLAVLCLAPLLVILAWGTTPGMSLLRLVAVDGSGRRAAKSLLLSRYILIAILPTAMSVVIRIAAVALDWPDDLAAAIREAAVLSMVIAIPLSAITTGGSGSIQDIVLGTAIVREGVTVFPSRHHRLLHVLVPLGMACGAFYMLGGSALPTIYDFVLNHDESRITTQTRATFGKGGFSVTLGMNRVMMVADDMVPCASCFLSGPIVVAVEDWNDRDSLESHFHTSMRDVAIGGDAFKRAEYLVDVEIPCTAVGMYSAIFKEDVSTYIGEEWLDRHTLQPEECIFQFRFVRRSEVCVLELVRTQILIGWCEREVVGPHGSDRLRDTGEPLVSVGEPDDTQVIGIGWVGGADKVSF